MKLIIINGPAGVGKSTLAARLHQDFSLSIHIDIDVIRRMISDFREHRKESGFLAFELAHGVVAEGLRHGHTVIIDKMMYGFMREDRATNILDDYITLGASYGATIHEIILWATHETVMARAQERGFCETRILTPEKVTHFWDQIDAYRHTRHDAHIIDTTSLSADAVYAEARSIIESTEN